MSAMDNFITEHPLLVIVGVLVVLVVLLISGPTGPGDNGDGTTKGPDQQ